MAGLKILVVGNGAREHAILWKLSQSPHAGQLYCAPGNAGTSALAENVAIAANQVDALVQWSTTNQIDLVLVGPEEPLALGLADRLRERGILTVGPPGSGARIESSKSWAKELMARAGVPTAAYARFENPVEAWTYARSQTYPIVLKADGLAAGKGVAIARAPNEAREAIAAALERRVFGDSGRTLLIEEYLTGDEVSLNAFIDRTRALPLVAARDHKRAFDGETGPNTGGMGAFAPTSLVNGSSLSRLSAQILEPIVAALAEEEINYRGVLYPGLILTADGPRVIEFNCRLGDPETQVMLPLLADDLVELAIATANGTLSPASLGVVPGYRCGIVLASGGYPGPYQTGLPIRGLDAVDERVLVFHAGTRREGTETVTAGGRVLTVVGQGPTLAAARSHAYDNARRIKFEGVHFREDIGAQEA
ncbi:MAG TPA: phosphoribosylamine--glycine ligase [Chloroflexota bacterium]|nr:phosphoribosylamine--glycine ligase [Chloroflexota bacterium]